MKKKKKKVNSVKMWRMKNMNDGFMCEQERKNEAYKTNLSTTIYWE